MSQNKTHRVHYAWWVLVACCMMMLGGQGIINNCSGIFYAPAAEAYGVGRGDISFYRTVANLATCCALPLAGKYLPRCNVRVVCPIAMTIICISAACMPLCSEVWMWYVIGAIQGLLGAFIFLVPAPVILANWFYKRSGFAVGFAMAFSGLGGVIFNPLISAAIAAWGWQTAYLVYAGSAAVVSLPFLIFVLRFKPEDMGLKPYGWDEQAELQAKEGNSEPEAETAAEATGVSLHDAVRAPVFWLVLILAGLIAFSTTYYQHFSGFATSIGWDTVMAGTLVSACSLGNMVLKLIYGALSDKIGVRNSTLAALVVCIIGFVIFLTMQDNVMAMYVAAVCYGATLAMTAVGAPIITKAVFGLRDYSRIYSRVTIATYLVGAIGMSGIAYIYDFFGSYDPAFMFGIFVGGVAIVLLLAIFAMAKKLKGSPQQALTAKDSQE